MRVPFQSIRVIKQNANAYKYKYKKDVTLPLHIDKTLNIKTRTKNEDSMDGAEIVQSANEKIENT